MSPIGGSLARFYRLGVKFWVARGGSHRRIDRGKPNDERTRPSASRPA